MKRPQKAVTPAPERVKHSYDLDAVFAWITGYKREHDGNSPSMRDIMRAFDISSTAACDHVLTRLERAGRIRVPGGSARALEVVGGRWEMATIKESTL